MAAAVGRILRGYPYGDPEQENDDRECLAPAPPPGYGGSPGFAPDVPFFEKFDPNMGL